MLDVKIEGTKELERKFRRMARRIKNLDMTVADVVRDWEVEDLGRDKPGAWAAKGTRVTTTIVRPHSRAQMRRSRLARRRKYYRGKTSTRAILRAEMLDKLIARLDEMLLTIKW